MDPIFILELIQTVGICGGAIVLVVIALFLVGLGGDLGQIIALLEGNIIFSLENIIEDDQPSSKSKRKRRR